MRNAHEFGSYSEEIFVAFLDPASFLALAFSWSLIRNIFQTLHDNCTQRTSSVYTSFDHIDLLQGHRDIGTCETFIVSLNPAQCVFSIHVQMYIYAYGEGHTFNINCDLVGIWGTSLTNTFPAFSKTNQRWLCSRTLFKKRPRCTNTSWKRDCFFYIIFRLQRYSAIPSFHLCQISLWLSCVKRVVSVGLLGK